MIACTDVHYTNTHAIAGCILFHDWCDAHSDLAITERVDEPAPYEPGRFYRRELPALLSVISKLTVRPEVIIIDGYVWLGDWDPKPHSRAAPCAGASSRSIPDDLRSRKPPANASRRRRSL